MYGIVAAWWSTTRPLDATSPPKLAASYNANFFLGFALNEMPLLIAFAICFMLNERWPFVLALPFHLLGMALIAPGPRNLERRQQEIRKQGSSYSLGRALKDPPT
jgi:hypothetical protein